MQKLQSNLDLCKQTRKIAAETLAATLKKALSSKQKISELNFQGLWLKELRKSSEIFPDGWYIPPPHGIGVVIAADDNVERVDFSSLRKEKYWPRKDIYLNKDRGLILIYSSPVSKDNLIIGDFGMTVYLGKNKEIKTHIKNCLNAIQEVYEKSEIGMSFSDISRMAKDLFSKKRLINKGWLSITGPTSTNMGHTIPFINENHRVSKSSSWSKTLQTISQSRLFVDDFENSKIEPPVAFTIEPRLKSESDNSLPSVYFHTIVQFKKNGDKELLTDFDEIFKIADMGYML